MTVNIIRDQRGDDWAVARIGGVFAVAAARKRKVDSRSNSITTAGRESR
jgi:hypothetical protein